MGPRIRRPLHNRHSGTRAEIQGWEFRIEPHVYSAQHGLSSVVMQRSPSARTREGEGTHKVRPCGRRPDGSPHPRGHGRGEAPTRCAPAEEGRMGPRIREDTGGGRPRQRDSSAPLHCARNEMWSESARCGQWGEGTGGSRTAPTAGGEPGDGFPHPRGRGLTEGVEAVNVHHGVYRFQRLAGRVLDGSVPIPDAPTQGLLGQ